MAEGQTHETMTPEEIRAFATKLEAWGDHLTPKEQAFLIEILSRATSTEDVAGHMPIFMKYDGVDGDVTLRSDRYVKVDVVLPVLTQIGSAGAQGSPHQAQWDLRDAGRG